MAARTPFSKVELDEIWKSGKCDTMVCAWRMQIQGKSIREIAREISRDPSMVSRELRASKADSNAYQHAKRPNVYKLDANPTLKQIVEDGLNKQILLTFKTR